MRQHVGGPPRGLWARHSDTALPNRAGCDVIVGQPPGTAPYGWRYVGGRLLKIEAEQAILKWILRAREGGMSAGKIAAVLAECGTPARGRNWYRNTVVRILERWDERHANNH